MAPEPTPQPFSIHQPTLPGMEHLAPGPSEPVDRVHSPEEDLGGGAEFTDEALTERDAALSQAPQMIDCETAFLVYRNNDGVWLAESDINLPVVPRRVASIRDMRQAADEVAHDVNTMLVTNHVITTQQALGQKMMEQARAQAMADRINAGAGLQVPFSDGPHRLR